MMNASEARKATEMAREELRQHKLQEVKDYLEKEVAPKVVDATKERKENCLVAGMDTISQTSALINEIKQLGYGAYKLQTSNEIRIEW